MTYKHATLPVSNLQIFQENPRFQPQVDQDAAITKILLNKKLFGLISDIAKNGLDPSESIMVFNSQKRDKYIVKEGNRRITSVKLLNDPELVPSSFPNRSDIIKRIINIKEENHYQSIPHVQCVIFEEDGELINHFIELKHTGENKGAGRIGWDTESQTRFTKQKDPYKNYLLSYINKIHPGYQDNSGFTTFERIISDPSVRKAIGMEIDRKKPAIILSDGMSTKKLFYIIDCLITKKIKVSDVYDKELRLKFIEKHLKTQEQLKIIETLYETYFKNGTDPSVAPTAGTTGTQQPVAPTAGAQNGSKNVTDPYKAKKLQNAYKFNRNYTNNARIRKTLFEINNAQIEDMPIALTYLIRSFLENYVHEYIDFHIALEGKLRIKGVARDREKRAELRDLLIAIKEHLNSNYMVASGVVALIEEVCDKSDHKHPLTTKLNIFVHSNLSIPTSRQVIDLWLKACPIAQQLDLALAQQLELQQD
ncbi:hypothetical protein [Bacillus wiedmannii]|uniref:hypothetical protein n=1 Tax=Bacillus wiedmannii TaxID=1890302 RepID=UPI000BF9AFF7|nr:hypothetical protein [Bacillus wiedmannii]PEP15484.1 hypothetical protein CN552_12475 [Bacillus wiedmannii]